MSAVVTERLHTIMTPNTPSLGKASAQGPDGKIMSIVFRVEATSQGYIERVPTDDGTIRQRDTVTGEEWTV